MAGALASLAVMFTVVAVVRPAHADGGAGGLTALPGVYRIGPNLVRNADFEQAGSSLPANWNGSAAAWSRDATVARAGGASMRLTDAATNATFFASQPVTLTKGVYRLSGWIKAEGLGANASHSGVRLSLDFSQGGVLARGLTRVVQGTFDWTYFEETSIVVPEDRSASIKLEAYARPSGLAWFDDVKVELLEPPPVEAFMLYPNYRGLLFDDQSPTMRFDVTVTPPVDDLPRYQVVATVSDEHTGIELTRREWTATRNFVAEVDGSALVAGTPYLVRFALVDLASADGAPVYTYPAYRIFNIPASAKAAMTIAVDAKNRLLVHGKPRFLLGVYDSGLGYGLNDTFWENLLWSPAGSRRMDGLKINFYLNYWYGQASAESMNALMANLGNHGVMYLQTGNCFDRRPASDSSFLIDTSDAYVESIGAHPGLGGYYTIDECDPPLVPGAFTQYRRLAGLDGDSMTLAALLPEPNVVLWRDAADVISTDPYPMYGAEPAGGYPHGDVARAARLTRDAVKDARPWMNVLQFFKFTSLGRWPTREEMRSHAYMSIVEGAHGLLWWSLGTNALANVCSGWCAQKIALMDQLKAVVNEIADLEPVLLADDAEGVLVGNSNAAIRTKVKVLGGKGYVFAYNSANTSQSATFTWNAALGGVTVHTEARSLAPAGSSFTDTFAPWQAHVYVLDTAPGLGVTPSAVDFGTLFVGESAERTFVVTNRNSTAVTGTATAVAPYSVATDSFNLAPGASQTIVVRLSPTVPGAFSSSVSFATSTATVTGSVTGIARPLTLTVTTTGAGSGTVTSLPAGIVCGSDCSESFSARATVTLTAAPTEGSVFSGWSGGGCSGPNPCTVNLTGDVTVTAAFTPGAPVTLAVEKTGEGTGVVTSAPAGIDCGETCSALYPAGTPVVLTATASPGSIFAGWSASGCSGASTCTVSPIAAHSVTAVFHRAFSGIFTDDPLIPGVTHVKAVHVTELRVAVDTLRMARGLPAFSWTEVTLAPGPSYVRVAHLIELRAALDTVYDAASRPRPSYTDALVPGQTRIRAIHFEELRSAVRALN